MKKKKFLSTAVIAITAIAALTFAQLPQFGKTTVKAAVNLPNWHPGHYLLANNGGASVSNGDYDSLLKEKAADGTPIFRGIQQKYSWNELEVPDPAHPGQYKYDFSQIQADLDHLQNLKDANGALLHPKLVTQIQTKAFGQGATATPAYIQGSYYGGGVYQSSTGSYNPVRWNDNVRSKLKALYAALGAQFNGNSGLESVVLSETAQSQSPDNINSQGVSPAFDYTVYANALSDEIAAIKAAFPNTVTIQYTNFPHQSLSGIVNAERTYGVGSGGPDIKAYPAINSGLIGTDASPGSYPYYANAWNFSSVQGQTLTGIVPLGTAVQYADYYQDDNKTIPANISDVYNFGHDKLKLNYIYWLNKPDRINDVTSFLKTKVSSSDKSGGLYTALPTAYQ